MNDTDTPDYPVEYRGNTVYDEAKVRDLQPEKKPNLTLVDGQAEVNRILDSIGVDHDPGSVVLEDSYGCLFVDVEGGAYTEVWGCHNAVPRLGYDVLRLK